MFLAAKLFAFLTQPLAWVAVLIFAALACMRMRPVWTSRLGWAALLMLLVLGWEPLPDALLRRLEAQYPALPAEVVLMQPYAGVVVLGGALESAYVWTTPGQSALNDAAERMTEVLPLLHQQPKLRVLFTGGEGELLGGSLPEAERARRFFIAQGVPPGQLLLESASRTTYENAVLSKTVPGVDSTQPWLLVTSAWHMPRSMASFQAAGWNVTAYPVDFRAGKQTPWSQYSMDGGVKKWKTALHEVLGLGVYRLTGRT
jgi:uncharacterized SAM-binding protein YcdF (DUF218 family)